MLAALVAKAHNWIAFHRHWQKLLDREEIPFSHLMAMEKGSPPFEGWDKPRCGKFVKRARRRIDKNCLCGFTVSISAEDHQQHYRAKLSDKEHKDGPYGACARQLIESIIEEVVAALGPDTVINFVFENNVHFEDARRVFRDLKDHVPGIASHMGSIASGEKNEFGGLQAADIIATLSRRAEPTAVCADVHRHGTCATKRPDGHIRIFHAELNEQRLSGHVRQAVEIAKEKRWAKQRRQRERRATKNCN